MIGARRDAGFGLDQRKNYESGRRYRCGNDLSDRQDAYQVVGYPGGGTAGDQLRSQ